VRTRSIRIRKRKNIRRRRNIRRGRSRKKRGDREEEIEGEGRELL
jgi:hypothetical protein